MPLSSHQTRRKDEELLEEFSKEDSKVPRVTKVDVGNKNNMWIMNSLLKSKPILKNKNRHFPERVR